jgi:hypothetical protein
VPALPIAASPALRQPAAGQAGPPSPSRQATCSTTWATPVVSTTVRARIRRPSGSTRSSRQRAAKKRDGSGPPSAAASAAATLAPSK